MTFSVCPVSAWTVTSPFGWRHHPITGEYTFHSGVDIAAEQGTPIGAVFAGETVYAGQWKGYGNVVVLKHSEDVYTLYGHCERLLVSPEQKVSAKETIATVGSTGFSTGPHLHLEVWYKGQYIDPLSLLGK